MAIALICPSCQVATTFHRAPISACPNCQSAFPTALRQPAEATLARQGAPQPVLITIGRYAAPGIGVLSLWGVLRLWSEIGSVVDQNTGETISTWDVLTHGGIAGLLAAGACLAVGVGIWQERYWSRHLMMVYWLVSFAAGLGQAMTINTGSAIGTVVLAVMVMGLAGWYLYDKENVVAYYKALEMRGRVGVTRAPDDL